MKNKYSAIVVVGTLLVPNLYASILGYGSMNITAPAYFATGDQAGPYVVSSVSSSGGLVPISSGGTFDTFCIGTQVDYSPPLNTSYQISDIPEPTVVGPPDVVTWGTAYLYSQYRANAFSSYFTLGQNNQMSDAFQVAIWDLQGQKVAGVVSFGSSDSSGPTANEVNMFLNDAATAAALAHVSSDGNNANGAFGVYALNMKSGSPSSSLDPTQSDYAQPQLVMVPEPTTMLAGAMLLLPFGMSTLRFVRRNRAA